MKRSVHLLAAAILAGATAAPAAEAPRPAAGGHRIIYLPARGAARDADPRELKSNASPNLIDHFGPVIISAKVVLIFWGPTFNDPTSPDYQYARTLQAYRNQFGTTPEYNVLTQYLSGYQLQVLCHKVTIQQSNLGAGTPDWFDPSPPPVNVTSDLVPNEVYNYFITTGYSSDPSTIYEVVLPSTSYSSTPTGTSCGGPNLRYCAYHSTIGTGQFGIAYSIQPYPSCGGCQTAGWSAVQNQEHFVCHETREAVTDPQGTGYLDRNGNEADDKCAWSPTPFIGTGGYAYQYEWSNEVTGCVRTR